MNATLTICMTVSRHSYRYLYIVDNLLTILAICIVTDKPCFPAEEEKVLEYWNKIDAFHEQLRQSEGKPEFTFYDGPPFATGLPHYGHIAAGTIKVSF